MARGKSDKIDHDMQEVWDRAASDLHLTPASRRPYVALIVPPLPGGTGSQGQAVPAPAQFTAPPLPTQPLSVLSHNYR